MTDQGAIESIDVDARLDSLLRECGRQEKLIYEGKGVPANEALSFIGKVARLANGLMGVTSLDGYGDVLELLDDSI